VTPSPADDVWRRLRTALDGFPTTMLRFARQAYGPGVVEEAWAEFTLWEDEEPRFDPSTVHMQVFMPWFFHRWTPDPADTRVADASLHGRSPTSALIERRPGRLEPLLRRYLEACLESPFTFHEILRADPGRGFRARDVFTGQELDVLERSASRTMEPGDLFFGQLATVDGVTLMEACAPHALPPENKLELIDFRSHMADGPLPLDHDSLQEWDIEIRELYLDMVDALLNPSPPALQNTDGEPIVFHRLSFAVDSSHQAFLALRHLALDEPEEELLESADLDGEGRVERVSFVWKVAGNPVHRSWDNTVLGQLEIEGNQLVANVNSAGRAERIKELVTATCPGARHLGTEIQTLEEAMLADARRGTRGESSEDSATYPPEVLARLAEVNARHYEEWIRSPMPALAGRTPLEAVRDRDGREKVEALIQQIERRGRTMNPPMDAAVISKLREDLGLRELSG
jgi:hypothetical protein